MELGNGKSRNEVLQAQAHVWNHCFKFIISMSLKCTVLLCIPEAIQSHGRPMTLSELVDALRIQPTKAPHLYRLMRLLVNSGFFALAKIGHSDGDEGYLLTPSSKLLLEDNPFSMKQLLLIVLDPVMTKPWENMSQWFQNDDLMPFISAHQMTFWEYAGKDEQVNNSFNEAMASDSSLVSCIMNSECKDVFQGVNSLVDVGGGTGTMAKAIARAFPHVDCISFDLPHVVANLKDSSNLKYLGGNMFEGIPLSDAILLKWVLHDWNDEECVQILKQCKKAIAGKGDGGKLIIVDMVLGSEELNKEETETQLMYDIEMMLIVTGRERNEKEWARLFLEAGFSSYKIHPILCLRAVIEVYP